MDNKNISNQVLRAAIIETSKHRDSYKIINDKDNVEEIISFIKNDDSLKNQWIKYQKNYEYAKGNIL